VVDTDPGILRIIDADADRAAEGLRVAEEYARFVLGDESLFVAFKELRHKVRECIAGLGAAVEAFRDSTGDPGREAPEKEASYASPLDVARANCKRAEEALRAVEEYLKTLEPGKAAEVKALRFSLYGLEQRLYLPLEKLRRSRLYVILTRRLCSRSLEETARMVLDGGADVIQLREKDVPDGEYAAEAESLKRIAEGYDVLFIVNDRPDIACVAGADGVHVGQEDIPPGKVRRVFPGGIVGLSTHSLAQARAGEKSGADYLGIGPVFPTATKQGREPVGVETAARVVEAVSIPVFAVGGVSPASCGELLSRGVRAVCACSAVISAEDPRKETEKLARLVRESG